MRAARPSALLALALATATCADKPGPEAVTPADDTTLDSTLPDAPPTDPTEDTRRPSDAAAGNPSPLGLWVEDDQGVSVGLLVRRGSDDQIADRAIYDIVTVYHPPSGVFFEITMSDAVVRYPTNTYFDDFDCGEPVGVAVGACTECKAATGVAFLHDGRWWKLRGGSNFQVMGPSSLYKGGLSTECIAHGTSNAKGFPVDRVEIDPPPATFTPPLRFVTR